ncbi:hypothetical protein D9758_018140 [Tetrapyrgos nigripes]|uniref:AAA+ ATPase domain-containing protein n=1 Tax=Tetrapyrgos nigripes TaxID=182062 RepID=A0A8H5BV23_9AGAR|nr:hypothetical protein D9758_018140 [Tetrapyrgos nigripes]
MSLLFNQSPSVQAKVVTSNSTLQHVALLGPNLWRALSVSQVLVNDKLCISISSSTTSRGGRALTCWALEGKQDDELAVPLEFSSTHKDIFSRKKVLISATEPVLLSELFISALSRAAYDHAASHPAFLERLLCDGKPILRQGSVYTSHPDITINVHGQRSSNLVEYRIDMAEPVIQGYAEKDVTSFVLTCSPASDVPVLDTENQEFSSDDDEGVEIDEAFLANSVVHTSFNPVSPANSQPSGSGLLSPDGSSEIYFSAENLTTQLSASHDDHTLYLRTADLGRLGLLSGDWAVACCRESSKSRLVRVCADDSMVQKIGVIKGSPVLLYNLNVDHWPSKSSLSLHPSPFGSREPVVPTARSVTIARIASPFSINRTYQSLFLQALKDYFWGKKSLVKKGDIIAVGIDTDDVLRSQDSNQEDDVKESHPCFTERLNQTVFFMITNVEHDVFLSESNLPLDTYSGSTAGELGCWFDPQVTKMVQAGLEHSRIPDVSSYLNKETYADILTASEMPSIGSEKPLQRLFWQMSVITEQRGVDFSLQLSILLKGARSIGKFTAASTVAHALGLHIIEVNCYDVIGENDAKTEGFLRARFENASTCSPSVLILRHLEAFSQTTQSEPGKEPIIVNALRDCIKQAQRSWKVTGHPTVIIGTTSQSDRVPNGLLSCFKHEVEFQAPDEHDRYNALRTLLSNWIISPDVSLSNLAQQTAAFLVGDLTNLVTRAEAAAIVRASKISNLKEARITEAGVSLTNADFAEALAQARASYSESIGAPKIPNVSWDDVGGLAQVKSDILDTIQLPLDHPELFADGLKKRSGILLYGPPGTGKTLVAKAVATSFSLNFFSVKGPELLNMYIGESEANLLAELDGTSGGSGSADVFVIGATNRPDLLDPALLRPGRFDRMLYLGVSQTHDAQLNILEALTRKFRLDPSLDLRDVAEQCSFNYTGADFYALCSDALLNAMTRKAEELEHKLSLLNSKPGPYNYPHPLTPQYYLAEMATEDDINVLVSRADFDVALRNLVVSVKQKWITTGKSSRDFPKIKWGASKGQR